MIPLRTRHALIPIFVLSLAFLNVGVTSAASIKSQVIARELLSKNIAHNKIGVDPTRKILVYLPAGYDESSSQRYPVIYFLPKPFEESYRYDFDHRDAQGLFDQAIANGVRVLVSTFECFGSACCTLMPVSLKGTGAKYRS